MAGRRRRHQPAFTSIVSINNTAVVASGTAAALPPIAPQLELIRLMSQIIDDAVGIHAAGTHWRVIV